MKILTTGNFSGWMGLHLTHFLRPFREAGHQIATLDYHCGDQFAGILPLPEALADERRNRALEKVVRSFQPDLILMIASWKFDLPRLKSYYHRPVAVYDYDGPRRWKDDDDRKLRDADLIFTVSATWQQELNRRGLSSYYLPHGVDATYYRKLELTPKEQKNYTAEVSFIGRATPRRVAFCRELGRDWDLRLYGERWHKTGAVRDDSALAACNRLRRNVEGEELVKIYSASRTMINILQEPLEQYRTILSLQCFAIPACAGCLIAETVVEAPEAFEPGREILLFSTPEELREQAAKALREPGLARTIGEHARKRILADHTHAHRMRELFHALGVS